MYFKLFQHQRMMDKSGISRLAQSREPELPVGNEDLRDKHNAEITF